MTGIDWEALRQAARAASERAYVPYSHYPVGVAALTDTGNIVTGANVENASYGLTLCAECALVSKLHTDALGTRLIAFACVDGAGAPLAPCGRCRQLLFEHGGPELAARWARRPRHHGRDAPVGVWSRQFGEVMSEPFDAVQVIVTKRDGHVIPDAQIDWVVDAYTRGVVADEQMSSLAMAILQRGMTRGEIARWTRAMIATGVRFDFSGLGKPTADKHSTGGVGDKITLPLAPLVASFGVAVPQLSGRGLGHTGGTLDKLESLHGWRADVSNEEMHAQLADAGAVICAAGTELAPADKKLYALRDVTGHG